MKEIATIYLAALSLLEEDLSGQSRYVFTNNTLKEVKELEIEHFDMFNFVCVDTGRYNDPGDVKHVKKITVQKKDISFSFTISKKNNDDLARMTYVYEICKIANNCPLILSIAKKQMPKYEKLKRKYKKMVPQSEYKNLNIHNLEDVVKFVNKITYGEPVKVRYEDMFKEGRVLNHVVFKKIAFKAIVLSKGVKYASFLDGRERRMERLDIFIKKVKTI